MSLDNISSIPPWFAVWKDGNPNKVLFIFKYYSGTWWMDTDSQQNIQCDVTYSHKNGHVQYIWEGSLDWWTYFKLHLERKARTGPIYGTFEIGTFLGKYTVAHAVEVNFSSSVFTKDDILSKEEVEIIRGSHRGILGHIIGKENPYKGLLIVKIQPTDGRSAVKVSAYNLRKCTR